MDPSETEALIARIPHGDLEALEGLYRDFHHAVFSYSLQLLRDRAQAEDNAQDVFLRIWSRASTYRPGGSPRAWIMGIAHNAAVDRQRRDGRETGIDDVPEELLADDGPGEERAVAALTLQDALRVLSPRDRRIVLLQAVAGIPAKDVGRLLRMPASTVHWRYRKALARLAAALQEGGPTWAREERN